MPSVASISTQLILRELETLKRQIGAYPDDAGPWVSHPGLPNTAGTLALHCAGNIQHFIGSRLGGSGFVRDRDAEFALRDVPRQELLAGLDRAIAAVHRLDGKSDADLPPVYPDAFGGKQVNTDVMLAQLAVHLAYHLGQVDYHRRLTTGDSKGLDAVSAKSLPAAV